MTSSTFIVWLWGNNVCDQSGDSLQISCFLIGRGEPCSLRLLVEHWEEETKKSTSIREVHPASSPAVVIHSLSPSRHCQEFVWKKHLPVIQQFNINSRLQQQCGSCCLKCSVSRALLKTKHNMDATLKRSIPSPPRPPLLSQRFHHESRVRKFEKYLRHIYSIVPPNKRWPTPWGITQWWLFLIHHRNESHVSSGREKQRDAKTLLTTAGTGKGTKDRKSVV